VEETYSLLSQSFQERNKIANRPVSLCLDKLTNEVKIAASRPGAGHLSNADPLNCRANLDVSGDEHDRRNPETKIVFDRYQLDFCRVEWLSDLFSENEQSHDCWPMARSGQPLSYYAHLVPKRNASQPPGPLYQEQKLWCPG
jgi:hypothetical protein